jgi:membrane dipeptidase
MAEFKLTLDLSHMDVKAALQSLDTYPGRVIASHSNALALLKGSQSNRHLTDQVIDGLLDRDGVIGIVPCNSFLRPGWQDSGGRSSVTLDYVAAQIDYICQRAGNSNHAGLGSDFDGGFGVPSVPLGIDTIADLRKIIPILNQKGYTQTDIAAILGNNWLAYLQNTLPEVV